MKKPEKRSATHATYNAGQREEGTRELLNSLDRELRRAAGAAGTEKKS